MPLPGPRLTRRRLLRSSTYSLGAVAAVGALPGRRLAGALGSRVAADAPALKVALVSLRGTREAALLAPFDETHRVIDGAIEVLLWPGDEARLAASGLDHRIVEADLFADRRIRGAVGRQPGEREDYRRLDDYADDLADLARRFPTMTRLIELPHRSIVGRKVYGLEIARDVSRRDGRPVIHLDGMHHCREWPAGEMPMMWAHDLLENYGTDPAMTNIVDNARTIVVPLVNPDGFFHSREAAIQLDSSNDVFGLGSYGLAVGGLQSYWRKNRRSLTNASVPVSGHEDTVEAYGIDLNRNYPFLWGDNAGSSGRQVDQTYRGSDPYSEPESRNIAWLVLGNAPITKITHHTSGEIMLFPWGRDPRHVRSPDANLGIEQIGGAMQAFNGYEPKQAFGLYPTSGTSRDWAHASVRSLVWTFEHGQEFHGPYGSTIPEMYAKNRGAFITHSEAALDPANKVVVTGRVVDGTGAPVAARVRATKDFVTPTFRGEWVPERLDAFLDVDAEGAFAFHLPPSTRPHLLEPEFGGPGTTEDFTFVIEAPGRAPVTVPVHGDRGDEVELGTIAV